MDNNLVLVKCSDIVSDHNVKLAAHIQNLVGQCPMTDCYFQPCRNVHQERNNKTSIVLLPWQHYWLQYLSVKNQTSPLQPFVNL